MTPPETLVLPVEGEWKVRVVPNLYPALDRQEVVVHSRRHIRSIAEAEDDELELVAEAWRRRAADEPGHVFPLLNEGREAGASLAHSHSQLVWLPEAPPAWARPRAETVFEQDGLTVACPWAARVPYETVIAPAEAEGDAIRSDRLGPALKLLAEMVRRLQRLEGQVPLNAWLEQGPADWRLVLFPRLNILAGLELGAGIYINTVPPEEAAMRLRAA
ncbi:MAG: UDPglucose--hexose-phosphate uridylyltransferase [Gaiellaceae bacterium]|jgi:UDPglucose--hexose-1-phosphate uridylyltransferase|nr:UDPglucose--hexose-phosphate uridylyltransferase [Gaiellaceae bacterium]